MQCQKAAVTRLVGWAVYWREACSNEWMPVAQKRHGEAVALLSRCELQAHHEMNSVHFALHFGALQTSCSQGAVADMHRLERGGPLGGRSIHAVDTI